MARGAAAGALARMALPALDGIRASWNDTCNYDNLNRRRVTPQRFPVVLEPAGDPSDLAVLRARRSEIMDLIHAHGAVLLRHWTTKELPAFVESLERVLGAEAEGTHYHKISMLRGEGRKATAHPHVFSASEAPATFFIPHHCEQSYINLRCRSGRENIDSSSLRHECRARAFQKKHPRVESAPRDDRLSKNEPKRVENDRDRSLQS